MEIVISPDTEFQCDKDVFLSNPVNKQNLIDLLSQYFTHYKGIGVKQHEKDADVAMYSLFSIYAMDKAMNINIMLVGDDAELLGLAVHYIEDMCPLTIATCSGSLPTHMQVINQ